MRIFHNILREKLKIRSDRTDWERYLLFASFVSLLSGMLLFYQRFFPVVCCLRGWNFYECGTKLKKKKKKTNAKHNRFVNISAAIFYNQTRWKIIADSDSRRTECLTLISCRSSEERFPKEHFEKFPATFAICRGHIVKESKNVSRPDARWKFSNLRGAAQPGDPG